MIGRRRALLICFACRPDAGSEAGAGWQWARAAAEVAQVTVITDTASAPAAEVGFAALGLDVAVIGVGLGNGVRRLLPRKLVFVQYLVWQLLAARAIRRAERDHHVDVVHHLTWASDSLPSALLASRAPVRVWGPVGGTTGTAYGLYRYLTRRGQLDQRVRSIVNATLRAGFGGWCARRATLVVALNDEVADRFSRPGRCVLVEPNLALDLAELEPFVTAGAHGAPGADGMRTALFVGRLIPWKGLLVAVRTLAATPGWRLRVFGDGPDRQRAERLATDLGVRDRITFEGQVPRNEVLAALAHADALLFPSFHDSAPWAAGEAAALGCPVVCLDAGGTALTAGRAARIVHIGDGSRLPERLAERLDGLEHGVIPERACSAERLSGLLASWYRQDEWGAPRPSAVPEQDIEIDLRDRAPGDRQVATAEQEDTP